MAWIHYTLARQHISWSVLLCALAVFAAFVAFTALAVLAVTQGWFLVVLHYGNLDGVQLGLQPASYSAPACHSSPVCRSRGGVMSCSPQCSTTRWPWSRPTEPAMSQLDYTPVHSISLGSTARRQSSWICALQACRICAWWLQMAYAGTAYQHLHIGPAPFLTQS